MGERSRVQMQRSDRGATRIQRSTNRPQSLLVSVQVWPRSPGKRAGEQIGFHQHLKAIADSDDRLAGGDEIVKCIVQMMCDLIGEDSPGRDVVAVTESAGDGEELKIFEQFRIGQQAIHMNRFGRCTGQLKCVGGFAVTIRAGGSKDQSSRGFIDSF